MRCSHTGLDTRMCGHCNGTNALEREPFNGRRRADDEPRLRKGRDSAMWVGLGRSLERETATGQIDAQQIDSKRYARVLTQAEASVNPLGLSKGSCIRPTGFSAWSREQQIRSLAGIINKLK